MKCFVCRLRKLSAHAYEDEDSSVDDMVQALYPNISNGCIHSL